MKLITLSLLTMVVAACGPRPHNSTPVTPDSSPIAVTEPEVTLSYACAFKETIVTKSYNSWSHKFYTTTKNSFDCISSKGEVCLAEVQVGKSGVATSCERPDLIDETTLENI